LEDRNKRIVQENIVQESRVQERGLIAFAAWLLAAAFSGPLGIFLHELGHYTAALSSGSPDNRMSFSSTSYQNSQNF
jgi:hypothetical protein